MSKRLFVIMLGFLFSLTSYAPANEAYLSKNPEKVFVKDGNIYYSVNDKKETQLTKGGKDRAPILSPDNQKAVFIRRSNELAYNPIDGADYPRDPHADQIWVIGIDGKNEKMLVRDNNPDVQNPGKWKGENVIGFIEDENIRFSSDGKTIYFLTPAWVTASALHSVNINGSNEHYITAANSLQVIDKGKYKNDLIISQHRYFLSGGSYDWYYIFTPEGKEIGPLGDDLATVDFDFLYSEELKSAK